MKKYGEEYLDKINDYVDKNKKDTFMVTLLGVIIFLLVIGYINIRSDMVMSITLPKTIKSEGEVRVGYNKANDLFYQVWGQYIVSQYASLSPSTVSNKLNEILNIVESFKGPLYSPQFQKKVEYIKTNGITQTYIPGKQMVLPNKQNDLTIFHSEGVLEERIGGTIIKSSCEYNIGMKIDNYTLFIGLINEKCTRIQENGGKL